MGFRCEWARIALVTISFITIQAELLSDVGEGATVSWKYAESDLSAFVCTDESTTMSQDEAHNETLDLNEVVDGEYEEDGPGSKFGVVQKIDDSDADLSQRVTKRLEATLDYMESVVWEDEVLGGVQHLCYNEFDLCTEWAVLGECDANSKFMLVACAPACQSCDQLLYETRCAVDPDEVPAWQPGDLNRMFERIVATHDNAKVWSRPSLASEDVGVTTDESLASYYMGGPWIISLDDFISPEEASRLIEWGGTFGYERSGGVGEVDEVTGEPGEGEVIEGRTSTNSWCSDECREDPVVSNVTKRIESLTGIPFENSEDLQLLRYEVGQFYDVHSDYIDYEWNTMQGPRILTVYMYLNDVEEGGETRFDWLDLTVKPKLGRVVVWPSVLDEDPVEYEERTQHEAMPVIQGQKFGANAWYHLRNRRLAHERNC